MTISISIAMCTFNGSRFLAEQLNTIALQTRFPDELVVCDDGSADNSAELVSEFSRRVSFPVQFFVNDTKLGSTRNFEHAIAITRGDIVVLADQDDAWYPEKLARIEQRFLDSEIVAAFSDADLMDANSLASGGRLWKSFSFTRSEQQRFAAGHAVNVLTRHPVVTGATMAFRRALFHFLSPIPDEDVHDRWMSFLLAALGRFALIPEPLMRYRLHHAQQIGVGAVTFSERMGRARQTGTEVYLAEIARFRELQNRLLELRASFPGTEIAIHSVVNKIAHLVHRVEVRQSDAGRLSRILREVRNHGYWNYSAGWESVAKDLFLYGQRSQ